MKLTLRLWIFGLVIAISLILIINADASTKLLVFALATGIMLILTFVKSKLGRFFIISVFILTIIFLIYNSFETGVLIKSIEPDSIAFQQGVREGEIIKQLNSNEIISLEDYSVAVDVIFPAEQTGSQSQRIDILTKDNSYVLFTNQTLLSQIYVQKIPKTQIKTGLDIGGGARALVQSDQAISESELQDLISVSRNRLNVFGIADLNLRGVTDLEGNKFMLVEVAGVSAADLQELLSKQGKFEAKIGEEVVFIGGEKDITNVCRNDATCASVTGCFAADTGYFCSFSFSITLSPDAAQRHADITANIPIDLESGGQYLTENLTLVLDDQSVDSLLISRGLKGQVTSQISIQGSGYGLTEEEAFGNAKSSMNELQTILITGSLPFKLNIVKLDTISPVLGEQFVTLLLLAGFSSILLVSVIIFIRYRKVKISLAILLTSFSELVIILGIASLIKWNLDLPSIAGILATIGTGVDQQIVILDEARSGKQLSIDRRLKRALFIVFSTYLTSLVALLPLYWAGAGLFKGFALTSIIGITAGVFVTRPAFADIIKKIEG